MTLMRIRVSINGADDSFPTIKTFASSLPFIIWHCCYDQLKSQHFNNANINLNPQAAVIDVAVV